ncbi:MAG: DUF6751 family protein [Chloroflexota bacterium]
MRTNADLTIYHRGVDPSTRTDTWTRSQVVGVAWEERKAANVARSGSLEADRLAVYIPLARGATVAVGDVVVKGLVSDTIGTGFTITALLAKYPHSGTVRSVDLWDQGSPAMHHLQLGAA